MYVLQTSDVRVCQCVKSKVTLILLCTSKSARLRAFVKYPRGLIGVGTIRSINNIYRWVACSTQAQPPPSRSHAQFQKLLSSNALLGEGRCGVICIYMCRYVVLRGSALFPYDGRLRTHVIACPVPFVDLYFALSLIFISIYQYTCYSGVSWLFLPIVPPRCVLPPPPPAH